MIKKIFYIVPIIFVFACAKQHGPEFVKVDRSIDRNQYEAFGKKFAIATQGQAATEAAKKMFDLGGNVFDAAIAASFSIFVERPQSTGLGGGGFMLIHHAKEGKTYAVDFREMAPEKSTEDMYVDSNGEVIKGKSNKGIYSVGVPGNVAGVLEVYEKYGSLPLEVVLSPAINLAEKGFTVYPHLENSINYRKDMFEKSTYAQTIFFNKDGSPKKTGDTLIQKDLAKTLKEIVAKGKDGFYKGWVAKSIVTESEKRKGLLTLEDFQNYTVKWREPVVGEYKGLVIKSMSPPSSGGTHIIQSLNILENVPLSKYGYLSPKSVHWTASATQKAFSDRAKYMGDIDFVDVPIKKFISKDYAKEIFKTIPDYQATKSDTILKSVDMPYESQETSHFSLMDQEGNAVSMTSSINYWLGSGVVAESTGVVLNNEMADFAAKPGFPDSFGVVTGKQNAISPSKRPLSSMSPTIVFDKNKKPILAYGTPDGARIISCMTEVFLHYFEYEMPLYDAVKALRFHHQWFPDEIRVEAQGFPAELQKELEAIGYKINNNNYTCKIQAVAKEKNTLHAVSDVRGEGMAYSE